MNILFLADCMAIGPDHLNKSDLYPYLVKEFIEVNYGEDADIEIIPGSGETTLEALTKLASITNSNRKYDLIFFAYGINDGLPRGIQRSTRGKIIRAMYKLKFSEKLRLLARAYFLNPLEFVMQYLRKPIFYNDKVGFIKNTIHVLNEMQKISSGKVIYISINPILNYRFVKGNSYLKTYNDEIIRTLSDTKFRVVDVFSLFLIDKLESFLDVDKFHYSSLGHEIVANAICEVLEKHFNEK